MLAVALEVILVAARVVVEVYLLRAEMEVLILKMKALMLIAQQIINRTELVQLVVLV
jgi:hypothetical protein